MSAPALPAHLPEIHRADVWDSVWHISIDIAYPRLPKDPARRARCEFDLRAFMTEYFAHRVRDLNQFHEETIVIDQRVILLKSPYFICNAEAAPRSIGKTTEKRIAVIWAVQCYRHGPFAVFFGATGPKGKENIDFIRDEWRTNTALRDDFPEIADWLDSFSHDPKLCKYKTPHAQWSDEGLYLPWGGYIEAFGMDNSLQGTNIRGTRPWWLIFEDTEGLDVASSSVLRATLKKRVLVEAINMRDKTRPGIASFVGTIYTKDAFTAEITDRAKRPEWNGRRYSGIQAFPENSNLWEEFEAAANGNARNDLEIAEERETCEKLKIETKIFHEFNSNQRRALGLYVKNFDAMNEGAKLLDDKRQQFSLWNLMYEKAINPEGFWCGIQNAPLDYSHNIITETKIDSLLIRCIGPDRGIIPEWGIVLLAAVDVGSDVRKGLHWCLEAFGAKGESCVIDCGIETVMDVGSTMIDDAKVKIMTLQTAMIQALKRLREKLFQGFPKRSTGEVLMPKLIGIDVRGTMKNYSWQSLIVDWCKSSENVRHWRPMLGQDWKPTMIATAREKKVSNGQWYQQDADKGGLYLRNSDYWLSQLGESQTIIAMDAQGAIMPRARIFTKDCPRRFLHHLCNYTLHARAADDVESKIDDGWHQKQSQPVDFADASAMVRNLWDIWRYERAQFTARPKPIAANERRQPAHNPSFS